MGLGFRVLGLGLGFRVRGPNQLTGPVSKAGLGTLRILAPNGIEGSTLLVILDKGLGFRGLGFRGLGV